MPDTSFGIPKHELADYYQDREQVDAEHEAELRDVQLAENLALEQRSARPRGA